MTLSKSSFSMDKRRQSISKTFSWLPSPIINNTKEDRQRTSLPFLNTHMNFTSPNLSLSPSTISSPTTTTSTPKKLGFFSKFKSSSAELDQVASSSSDEEEEEEEEEQHLPRTPRDSQQLTPSSPIALMSSSSSVTLPVMVSSSLSLRAPQPTITTTTTSFSSSSSSETRALTIEPIVTTTLIDQPQDTLASPSSSLPPHPPQHSSLCQYVQKVLASTFDDVDKTIEMEWDQDRQRLEIDLVTPAPFQY